MFCEKILGAEAEIKKIKKNNIFLISKKRIQKNYRDQNMDFLIRKKRTKSEAKIINQLYPIINVPKIFEVNGNEFEILMEFIPGDQLKKILETKKNLTNSLCTLAGKEIKKIHDFGIIHGDLTTSNILFYDNKLFFIDFGLGFFSKKIEDQATDLIVFKKTFNATHSSIKNGWELVLKGYDPSDELKERMLKIQKRARYL